MMQQAVALQQMQFQQALAMQQAASAQAAAARAATMKSATEAAAARAKEISMKLKAEGFPAGTGGVEVDGVADGNKEGKKKSRSIFTQNYEISSRNVFRALVCDSSVTGFGLDQ